MKLIRTATSIEFSDDDMKALEVVMDIFDDLYHVMTRSDMLLGYNEDEIGNIYFTLNAFLNADDKDLKIVEM